MEQSIAAYEDVRTRFAAYDIIGEDAINTEITSILEIIPEHKKELDEPRSMADIVLEYLDTYMHTKTE